ncbi:hypothetical protein V1506DRAFT_539293 [Lipomyces tetrasporus]
MLHLFLSVMHSGCLTVPVDDVTKTPVIDGTSTANLKLHEGMPVDLSPFMSCSRGLPCSSLSAMGLPIIRSVTEQCHAMP